MAKKDYAGEISLELVNDEKLLKLLNELDTSISNRTVLAALRKAGKAINDQAKSNLSSRKKNKSKTGYSGINTLFKVQEIKNKDRYGVKVGLTGGNSYKYRWINWGTVDRQYMKKSLFKKGKQHFTGRIQPTLFFTDAVTSKREESRKTISDALIKSLKKIENKYADNKSS
jgi:HK97 gp10 family phage protein